MIQYPLLWSVLESGGRHINLSLTTFLFKGSDTDRFLNGQLTQNIEQLTSERALFSARLNNKGQIKSWQILARSHEGVICLVERELAESFRSDLEKYIIMDDVEILESEVKYALYFGGEHMDLQAPWISAFGLPARLLETSLIPSDSSEISASEREQLSILGAWPAWNKSVKADALVNETIFEQTGVSYSKGCFLGQETAAKIHSRRGASYAPALLIGPKQLPKGTFEALERKAGEVISSYKEGDQWVHLCQLFREFRVEGIELEISDSIFLVNTQSAPFSFDLKDWAQHLYDYATELFKGEKEQESLKLLKVSLALNPSFADAYEVLGVILGRHERYQEAIEYMDKLSDCDPNSIMAHTNKSLYLMKLGKITEAEEEKSKATVKTFEKFGREAVQKREAEARIKAEKVERERRRSMFEQVLEIDAEDEIALFGLGDLAFSDGNYDEANEYFSRVLKSNPKHSRSYLMSAKTNEALGNNEKALELYKQGMEVATKAGELMPAAEMRSRMVALSR